MYARCPGFLGETGDQFLHLLADDHHEVGQLVDHHDDERQIGSRGSGFSGVSVKGFVERLAGLFAASRTFWLNPDRLRTPMLDMSL